MPTATRLEVSPIVSCSCQTAEWLVASSGSNEVQSYWLADRIGYPACRTGSTLAAQQYLTSGIAAEASTPSKVAPKSRALTVKLVVAIGPALDGWKVSGVA